MTQGGGSAGVNAPYVVTPYQGIKTRAGAGVGVTYSQGVASSSGALPPLASTYLTPSSGTGAGLTASYYNNTGLTGTPVVTRNESNVDYVWGGASPVAGVAATNWSAKWTGTLHPPTTGSYQLSLTSDDGSRVFINGQQIINNWFNQGSTTRTGTVSLTAGQAVSIEVDYYNGGGASNATLGWSIPGQSVHDQAVAAARAANVAVVFVSNFESEGGDLSNIDLSAAQNTLVTDVAAANPNTVVVVNSGSAVTMPWAGAVKGIVEAWYPGQEDGNAIASLLYGDTNFSGKLPVTFPTLLSQGPTSTTAQWPGPERHRAVLRRAQGRLPLVRRPERHADVPVRVRAVVHLVRVRESDRRSTGRERQRGGRLRRDQQRHPRRRRGSAGLRGAAGRRR